MDGNRTARVARSWLIALLFASAGWAQARTPDPQRRQPPPEPPPPQTASDDAVAKALGKLDGPLFRWLHANEPPFPTKTYLPYDNYEACSDAMADAIHLLVKTKRPVEKELLDLARSSDGLGTRYRAVRILAERGEATVVPVLDKMCASDDPEERYLGWQTYAGALRAGQLKAPTDFRPHLALYAAEKDREVRETIECFFGAAKAKAAVKSLLETVKANPDAVDAISALGEIGDKGGVPAIIDAYKADDWNHHCHLHALGKLATPEAVDFLIEHLGEYGAVEALFESKSDKALPALQKHLEKLKNSRPGDKESDLAATRVAVIRLSEKDPRETLMKIAEDKDENRQVRWDCFSALHELDAKPFHARILKVYVSERDVDLKSICIRILKDSDLDGVTDAMIAHALTPRKERTDEMGGTDYDLREALNKRLGTSFRTMDDLQAHVRELRKRTPERPDAGRP
jgi:HEAT repeat protein